MTRDERVRSQKGKQDLINRMRRQIAIDDIEIAKTFGAKPDQTVISSCTACSNEDKNQTEVCCYGLFKGKTGGLQWRCASSQPNKIGISRSTKKYVIDNFGNKTFKRGNGNINNICLSLGNQMNEAWSGAENGFLDMLKNKKSCKAATNICKT